MSVTFLTTSQQRDLRITVRDGATHAHAMRRNARQALCGFPREFTLRTAGFITCPKCAAELSRLMGKEGRS